MGRLDAQRLWLPDVHRIDRRRFVADLGRRTLAMAILGTGIAACSSSTDSTTAPAATPQGSDPPAPTPTDAADAAEPAVEATAEPEEPVEAEPTATEPATAALSWTQVLVGNVSAFVLVRGNHAAVVDTGNPGSADDIGNALNTMGVNWDDVGHVILTHKHPDHVGSLNDVLAQAPTAMAYAGEADIGSIRSDNPLRAVGDGDNVFGLDVLNTPGHTPGSISVLDTEIGLLLAGDALNGNAAGTEVLGPNPGFSEDMTLANESVEKLAGFAFDAAGFGHGNPVQTGAGELVARLAASL